MDKLFLGLRSNSIEFEQLELERISRSSLEKFFLDFLGRNSIEFEQLELERI